MSGVLWVRTRTRAGLRCATDTRNTEFARGPSFLTRVCLVRLLSPPFFLSPFLTLSHSWGRGDLDNLKDALMLDRGSTVLTGDERGEALRSILEWEKKVRVMGQDWAMRTQTL